MKPVAIIPARMASSRFPGKPLAKICGMPMIAHVYHRVMACDIWDDVVVATCDREIADVVETFGGRVAMTSDRHKTCIDRIAEAARAMAADIIVNVQGDMPLIHPESLQSLVTPLATDGSLACTDMMGPIDNEAERVSPNVVKVVTDSAKNALYYSREPIPSTCLASIRTQVKSYKQFGVMAFRKDFLLAFAGWPRCDLEAVESVDMLRALYRGHRIRMVVSRRPVVGVDTPVDLEHAEKLMQKDPLYASYARQWDKTPVLNESEP